MIRLPLALAAMVIASPTLAETCIVDYETFAVRALQASDHVTMPAEQSLLSYSWGMDVATVVAGDTYEKYGLPRRVGAGDLEFYGFRDSVPFMRATGSADSPPDLLYALSDAEICEVQPYTIVP